MPEEGDLHMSWTRVKDKATGHEYSVQVVNEEAHTVIDKPAADDFDRPLPAKHNINKGGTPASKESAK